MKRNPLPVFGLACDTGLRDVAWLFKLDTHTAPSEGCGL
jgi:hypothetical protein